MPRSLCTTLLIPVAAALILSSATPAAGQSAIDSSSADSTSAPSHQNASEGGWSFTDISVSSGIDAEYLYVVTQKPIEPRWICGGAAAGDIDGDGYTDLYLLGGESGSNVLYRNLGDGTFQDATLSSGLEINGVLGCGPIFADMDGDGDDDLLVLSVAGSPEHVGQPAEDLPEAYPLVFQNQGDGTFLDVSAASGLDLPDPTYAGAFADIDGDGDLDAFTSRWRFNSDALLWRNDGGGTFTDVATAWFGPAPGTRLIYSFTPNFADIDGDRRPDLLVAGDFGNSRVFLNRAGTLFRDITDAVISDENGMGAAVGDVDNDGHLDWFVSSIWDPDGMPDGGNWGVSGNRLYRNLGNGSFEDITDAAGVREGYWGWGSCFADFDNDRDLDLFHVNGFPAKGASEFFTDPARLFLNNGDGTFVESSVALGAADTGQGRGVVCFDLEHDGDIDILIAQNGQPSTLLRNDLPTGSHFLSVTLDGPTPNTRGIGARIEVEEDGLRQIREIRAGSNFISQDPAEAHFGLGSASSVDVLRVLWPDGRDTVLGGLEADQRLDIGITTILLDGFESGSTVAWSETIGDL